MEQRDRSRKAALQGSPRGRNLRVQIPACAQHRRCRSFAALLTALRRLMEQRDRSRKAALQGSPRGRNLRVQIPACAQLGVESDRELAVAPVARPGGSPGSRRGEAAPGAALRYCRAARPRPPEAQEAASRRHPRGRERSVHPVGPAGSRRTSDDRGARPKDLISRRSRIRLRGSAIAKIPEAVRFAAGSRRLPSQSRFARD